MQAAGDGRRNLTNIMAGTQRRMTSGCSGDHVHSDGGRVQLTNYESCY